MHLLSVLSLAGVLAVAFSASLVPAPLEEFLAAPLSDEELEVIKDKAVTWKATKNFEPTDMDRVKCLLGTRIQENPFYTTAGNAYPQFFYPEVELPTNFDSRQQWPQCETMKKIYDQSNCGSCWAFGSVEAMSDRICVANNVNVTLSVEEVMSCCEDCGDGCEGGYPYAAWNYFKSNGIVTGGPYGSQKGCLPYEVKPCHKHIPECMKTHPTPRCEHQCIKGYSKTFEQDKHFGSTSYSVSGVQNIQKDIQTYGPLTAAFTVYSDFMQYKSGVYSHTTGHKLGGHAVKIIGWGVEAGEDYWLVANSWTPKWGDNGYFKIRRGTNECGIEANIFSGLPKKAY